VWKDLAMARTTPIPLVDHTLLVQPKSAADAISVGSPAWYAWLTDATSFAFRSEHGTFTAHKERRGLTKEYWKAYRRRDGRLHRVYLGKSAQLTLEHLNAVAADLTADIAAAKPTTREASLNTTQDVIHPVEDAPKSYAGPVALHSSLGLLDDHSVRHTSTLTLAPDGARSLHLLATKLAIPPSRANLVPRPRLVEQLDVAIGQGRKLVLISAPAGFGKTTAVIEWLAERAKGKRQKVKEDAADENVLPFIFSLLPFQVAWLALDDDDNHLGQFLAYLIAALETARPGIGAEAWPLLRTRAAEPPTHAIPDS
jgi:LuxR family maltose regulon positive regulatory protein